MPISFVASTKSPTTYPSSTNNTSDCILAKPSGTVAGDVMVVYLEAGAAATFSYPAGWREVSKYENTAASMTSAIAYKVVGASEGTSYTFGDNLGDVTPLCGMILTYRGVAIDDPIADPVNARAESNTGTTGTAAVVAPAATSTADGWFVWFRAGKISTTNPTLNAFTISGGTAVLRQDAANRGGSTEYFIAATDSNSVRAAGTHNGATFTRTGSGTFSGSIARTIVLKQAQPPTTGVVDVDLGAITATSAANVHNDATMSATLGGIGIAAAGEHFPPGFGPMAVQLGGVSLDFAGSGVGGGIAMSLSPVTASFAGSVNPIGALGVSLGSITVDLNAETRVFGRNVILVEPEKRALQITQDEIIPIYKADVLFEPIASPFSMTLGRVGMSFTAETTSGDISMNLAPVDIDWDAKIIYGGIAAQLGAVTAAFTGSIIHGSFSISLRPVTMPGGFSGAHEASGSLEATLGGIGMAFTDSPAGPFHMDLGGIEIESEGAIIFGEIEDMELPGIDMEFEALSTTEDLLKFADDIGDGTNTSYTVTHNAGTRDVVVTVYDTTTYEEVVPLTLHATTNTVTVQFASAPSTDAYRVVVLYSSV